jgi:hypothetical protein
MRNVRNCFEKSDVVAKALGHFSPYGSYWTALSLIIDGVDQEVINKYVSHVDKWSQEHILLRPRILHLRAELASRSDRVEVSTH